MNFEYDRDKSRANKWKHGIDFDQAKALWDDPDALEFPARTEGEPRFIVTGMLRGKYWSAVVTYRNENIRLISVRRSWKKEIEAYEKNQSC